MVSVLREVTRLFCGPQAEGRVRDAELCDSRGGVAGIHRTRRVTSWWSICSGGGRGTTGGSFAAGAFLHAVGHIFYLPGGETISRQGCGREAKRSGFFRT